MAITGGTVETLDEIPAHMWKGLPDCLSLGPSAVNQNRIGLWATRVIPKGERFGPFVGEKKKRSQVTSNVYMWEVYFPARGWMCVDATDPMKGNWLRYVNWARSSEEQNLFPLEINRAIYYKVLRPIGPGEELLVWYTVEDNPEITAALEEERASSLSRTSSPRAKRARGKLLERARRAGLGGFKKTGETKPTVKEMWDGDEGPKEEGDKQSSLGSSQELLETYSEGTSDHRSVQDMSEAMEVGVEEEEEGEEEEDEEEDADDLEDPVQGKQQTDSTQNRQPGSSLIGAKESHNNSDIKLESLIGQEPDLDPDLELDPDGDPEGDPHGESYPCQHCERHFSSRQGLERHIHIHAITNQQTQLFKCRYCSKAFGSQVGRRRHERRHESGPKKRPGSLAGTGSPFSAVSQTDGSSPDCSSPATHYIAIGTQLSGGPLHNSEMQRKELGLHADRPFTLDENGESSKELHPCKYCNKAFGTHTNMRRHQRRIHERHLLPKGVRRKGMLQQQPGESPGTSPPPVYVPSADTEDEADGDDYAVDISKNISENLSFYIDGKIVSTNAVSSCEVIEVDSSLFGLDTVIISPSQISQALKVEGRTSAAKQVSNIGQQVAKRRTSTPPLVPSLKVETETASLTATSSSSSTSSSSNLLVGGLFQQATDSSAFQREKTVYLSPKLKQLLQTQDMQKSTISLITESHRLASPLSVTSLPGASGRFKRRTGSPPSSPQLSPAGKTESCKAEASSSYTLKALKLESHRMSPPGNTPDKDDGDTLSPSGTNTHGQTSSSGGNSCNQQPLDLSNSINRKSDSLPKVLGDSALDLSFHHKSSIEPELKGGQTQQPPIKKRKPNTSMLEKVLMNEYVGEEGSPTLANISSYHSRSPNIASDSAQPSPPSLTPVTMNPSSPGTSSVTSPTPPPPVLPTMPSPQAMPGSPLSQPSDAAALRLLPVLSPEMSPRSKSPSDSEETFLNEENKNDMENCVSEPLDSPSTPPKEPTDGSVAQSPPGTTSVDPPSIEDVSLTVTSNNKLNCKKNQDTGSLTEKSIKTDLAHPPSVQESSSSSASSPLPHDPCPSLGPQSLNQVKIKEEPLNCVDELAVTNHASKDDVVDSSPQPSALDKPSSKTFEAEEVDMTYCKTFVCNVCEVPFNSIKELTGHITEHAADWPFKCEFCVQLFSEAPALLAHRTTLHGVGKIFVCSVCSKEFAFLCNLQQHQKDLHPNETCSHTTVESGKLRPQNYTDPSRAKEESNPSTPAAETTDEPAPHVEPDLAKEEADVNGNGAEDGEEDPNEELYTTIKIMASEGGKPKGPDVRLGINQHYPSYKPPPFPYHSRSHAGSVASATNFTTHNIPQTFSTAIRCTKCGNSFDNMPELHKHILACANASDKKRYTPKKNPIPLKQIVKSPNGVVSPTAATAVQSAFRRMGQPKRLNFNQDTAKTKMSALSKKRNQLVQKAISQRNKTATTAKKVKIEQEQASNICPHCSREFTYPASLSKHMLVSCPMKPVVKKGKKGLAEVKKEVVPVADKNMNLRKKVSDCEMQQPEPTSKRLGKTRARSSGPAADPEPSQVSKVKTAAALGHLKRPASFPAPGSVNKKSKKGQVQSLPLTPPAPDTPSDTAPQRPTMRMQRMGKEVAPKRLSEAKPPIPEQLKERFSLRTRKRVGGPVTRSLQMSNPAPVAEVKAEEAQIQEPKETQEVLMK